MTDYTTLALVRQTLNFQTAQTGDDALIGTLIQDASALIDGMADHTLAHTLGTLYLDAAPPYQFGRRFFFRDDVFSGVDAIYNNGTIVDADTYTVLPVNSVPKMGFEFHTNADAINFTDTRRGVVRVEGTLGHFASDAIPNDVRFAATKLAVYLYQNRDKTGDILQMADGTTIIPATMSDLIERTLQRGGYMTVQVYF